MDEEKIKLEKVVELDINKQYIFHIPNSTQENCDRVRNIIKELGFKKKILVIGAEELNIYEIKQDDK